MRVAASTVKLLAGLPPNVTPVTLAKLEPVIVTSVPGMPLVGANDATVVSSPCWMTSCGGVAGLVLSFEL